MKSKNRPAPAPDTGATGHAPKTYTGREQIMFTIKLALITGTLVVVLWLLDAGL